MKTRVSTGNRNVIIGIDLGTTNSCVAIYRNGRTEVIPNAEGARTTPSVVGWNLEGELVGNSAKRQIVLNPATTLHSIKRIIGLRFSDDAIQNFVKQTGITVHEGKDGETIINIPECSKPGTQSFSPVEISAKVLRAMKRVAEGHLGCPVSEAVITVPAYFSDSQRQATLDAAMIAGLTAKRIVNEPTAAALAYGLDQEASGIVAVYDLGGGTFDVSLLKIENGLFEVLATAGDNYLGGDDIDHRIVEHLVEMIKAKHGLDIDSDRLALTRLRDEAEKAKIRLSSETRTDIKLPYLFLGPDGPVHLDTSLSRRELEDIAKDIIDRTEHSCHQVLADSELKPSQIDHLLLVGGMTRMPLVQQLASKIFQKAPRATINPDEVVALGAAAQGAILSGALDDFILMDIIPLTLGVEIRGDIFSRIIPRNSVIPISSEEEYTTIKDNQTSVSFNIYQGERDIASANKLLGEMDLTGIPPGPKGMAKIIVTFNIDENGVIEASAREQASGKECRVTLTNTGGLSEKAIEQIIKLAEQNERMDAQKKKEAENKNHAEDVLYDAKKLTENQSGGVLLHLQAGIDCLDKAIFENKYEEIFSAMRRLKQIVEDIHDGKVNNKTAQIPTHYDILEIKSCASPEVIKGAYKFLSQKYHPDKNPGPTSDWTSRKIKAINTAYEVLSDPSKRAAYDKETSVQI
jgi:molecular chaperone DnaK